MYIKPGLSDTELNQVYSSERVYNPPSESPDAPAYQELKDQIQQLRGVVKYERTRYGTLEHAYELLVKKLVEAIKQ